MVDEAQHRCKCSNNGHICMTRSLDSFWDRIGIWRLIVSASFNEASRISIIPAILALKAISLNMALPSTVPVHSLSRYSMSLFSPESVSIGSWLEPFWRPSLSHKSRWWLRVKQILVGAK